jgi:hypothetical protein
MSKDKVTEYQIRSGYEVCNSLLDNEDVGEKDTLESALERAQQLTREDGRTRYITQTLQVVAPVKQPYEVVSTEFVKGK